MKRRRYIFAGVVAALAFGVLFGVGQIVGPRCTELSGTGTLSIPISRVARRAVDFFCYRDGAGRKLRFLLAQDSDGHIHAVFDACKQCYRYHEGFTAKDGYIICRLCGTRYKVMEVQTGKASCVPVALHYERRGNTVEVKVSDLNKGRALF
ncbi:MAG: Fe-S-containing protein [Candidatus Binataceae bacterium]